MQSQSKQPKKQKNTKKTTLSIDKNLELKKFKPLTKNQNNAFDYYYDGYNLCLLGSGGTGKTFIALFLALETILEPNSPYKKIYVIRSLVPSRDIGFLPGNAKEKAEIYEQPYKAICTELFNRGDAYNNLKSKNIIEFVTTSFLRGTTFNDCIIIADEVQNFVWNELLTTITRTGKNTKLLYVGDVKQSDIKTHYKTYESNDILKFMKVIETMDCFKCIKFTSEDIVRSGITKEFIINAEKLGYM